MSSSEFDTYRREASRLERQLEDRINKYQQLGQKITTSSNIATGGRQSSLLGRPGDLEGGSSSSSSSNNVQVMFIEETKLSADIERMLQTFKEQNDRMATVAERSQHHVIVKRCREITYDFQSDYQKIRQGIQRRKETFELFTASAAASAGNGSNGGMKRSTFGVESGNSDGDMEHLLRERNHITNSSNAANSILGQAGETFNELKNQRKSLMGASGTLVSMAQTIPGVNRLIEQIRVKRNKDDLIVAGVIAGCIVFTLWYLFS